MQLPAGPLLTSALAIALRLIRINLAHFLQEILGVRPRDVGRLWATTIAVALLRPPRNSRRFLNALRHKKNLGIIRKKANRGGVLARAEPQCQHDGNEDLGDGDSGGVCFCIRMGTNA